MVDRVLATRAEQSEEEELVGLAGFEVRICIFCRRSIDRFIHSFTVAFCSGVFYNVLVSRV